MNIKTLYIVAAGAGVGALILLAKNAGSVGGYFGGAMVDMADGLFSGAVTGVGELVGIPKTNMTECERAIAEGRTWDASFACPAGDFLGYLFS